MNAANKAKPTSKRTTTMVKERTEDDAKQKKRVTFKHRVGVREIPVRKKETVDDPVWYNHREYAAFQSRNDTIIKMMQSHSMRMTIEKKLGDSTRGLEQLVPEAVERNQARRRVACNAVFSLQAKHYRSFGRIDAEAVARLYDEKCQQAKYVASMFGLRDWKYVKEYVLPGYQQSIGMDKSLALLSLSKSSTSTSTSTTSSSSLSSSTSASSPTTSSKSSSSSSSSAGSSRRSRSSSSSSRPSRSSSEHLPEKFTKIPTRSSSNILEVASSRTSRRQRVRKLLFEQLGHFER